MTVYDIAERIYERFAAEWVSDFLETTGSEYDREIAKLREQASSIALEIAKARILFLGAILKLSKEPK